MKNRLAIAALALTVGLPVFAQDTTQKKDAAPQGSAQQERAEKRRERGNDMREKMAKELNLTDAQKTQLRDLNQKDREQMQSIRNDSSLTQEQKKEKMQALRSSRQSQMSSILTPEQQQKWAQVKENHKGKMGKHGRHGRGRHKGNAGTTGF